jgi:hypothetical protein
MTLIHNTNFWFGTEAGTLVQSTAGLPRLSFGTVPYDGSEFIPALGIPVYKTPSRAELSRPLFRFSAPSMANSILIDDNDDDGNVSCTHSPTHREQ